MRQVLARRLDPDARAGLRLTLLGLAFVLLALLVLPLAVLVRDRWEPLRELDLSVEEAAHRAVLAHPLLLDAAKAGTWLGAPLLLDLAALLLAGWLLRRGRRRSALLLVAVVAGAYLLSSLTKLVVARSRPSFVDAVYSARGASFPSGHATGSAAFYTALVVVLAPLVAIGVRRLLLAVAVALPLLVAATRVLLGVHFASDVVAGLLLGWGWSTAVVAVFALWRTEEGRRGEVLERGVEPEPAR